MKTSTKIAAIGATAALAAFYNQADTQMFFFGSSGQNDGAYAQYVARFGKTYGTKEEY